MEVVGLQWPITVQEVWQWLLASPEVMLAVAGDWHILLTVKEIQPSDMQKSGLLPVISNICCPKLLTSWT
jgi:hypothetical protein